MNGFVKRERNPCWNNQRNNQNQNKKLDLFFDDKLSIGSLEFLENSYSSEYKNNNNLNFGIGLNHSLKKNFFNKTSSSLNNNLIFMFSSVSYVAIFQKLLIIIFFTNGFKNKFQESNTEKKTKLLDDLESLEYSSHSIEEIVVYKLKQIIEKNPEKSLRILLIFYLFFEKYSEDILFEHLILLKLNQIKDENEILYEMDFLASLRENEGEYYLNFQDLVNLTSINSFINNLDKSNTQQDKCNSYSTHDEFIANQIKTKTFLSKLPNKIKATDFLIINYFYLIQEKLKSKYPADHISSYLKLIDTSYKTNKLIIEKVRTLQKKILTNSINDLKKDNISLFDFMKENKRLLKENLMKEMKSNFEFTNSFNLLINNSKLEN